MRSWDGEVGDKIEGHSIRGTIAKCQSHSDILLPPRIASITVIKRSDAINGGRTTLRTTDMEFEGDELQVLH